MNGRRNIFTVRLVSYPPRVVIANCCCGRTILRDLHNLTSVDDEWRKAEAASLSALVQRRIQYLQVTTFYIVLRCVCQKLC